MHLTMHLAILLAGLLTAISVVEAAPAQHNAGMITLPIRSLHRYDRKDLHPLIHLRSHLNRAERRLARMTGRTEPSDDELRARLHKRMYIVGHNPIRPSSKLDKRYRRPTGMLDSILHKAQQLKGTKFKASGSGTTAGGNSTGTGAAAGNATAGTGTGQGVSAIDIQAAVDNTLTKANPPTAGNSLGLDIEGPDTGYIAQVKLGTPPRNFEILMDSGSADFWVGSENCKADIGGGCGNHQFLGNNTSSTFVDKGTPFSVTYGTGKVSGTIVQDDLDLAGLKLKGHVFGVADTESVDFSSDNTKFDGLMGLAQSGLSQQKTPTPIEALVAKGLLKDAITSYKIPRLADEKNDGEITFGGLDTTKFDQATLVTLPNINTQGFWEGAMDAVTVDGQDTGLSGRTAILDTGTTLIVAPTADAAAVHQLIKGSKPDGQGGFLVPCTTTQSVALKFGGRSFAIDPRDIAPIPVDINNPTGDCISGISAGEIGGAQEWLVGDVFLKNAYFSTNVQKNTVSLAKLK